MAAFDDILHRRIKLGLDANDLDVGLRVPWRRSATPRNQPAAADRDHQHVEFGRVLKHLQPDRPCPRHDRDIVERMDENIAFVGFQLARMGIGVVEPLAMQHDMGAMAFGLGDFDHRRRHRHDDRHRDAEAPAMIGDRLGMVAGRRGDHAARPLRLSQAAAIC